jgi:hypothetical protein
LTSVERTLGELDSLEQTYTQQKGLLTSTLASHLQRLAEISDTQAVRAQTIRTLYWEKNLSAGEIGKAFGLKEGAVRKLAGKMILDLDCQLGCGSTIRMEFGSRHALNEVTDVSRKRRPPLSARLVTKNQKRHRPDRGQITKPASAGVTRSSRRCLGRSSSTRKSGFTIGTSHSTTAGSGAALVRYAIPATVRSTSVPRKIHPRASEVHSSASSARRASPGVTI